MYKEAFELISKLTENKEIENIYFLKNGKISIKFTQEKTRLHFNSFCSIEILELIEAYEQKRK
ncbi:MAG: hypothetical protein ACK518_04480 [bacterium]|jgi:hypothetical protein